MKIKEIVETLADGGVVILPSDTCYMLAAVATNQAAVNKILSLKPNLVGKPISVVMADWKMVNKYVNIDREKLSLAKKLLPGAYTLVANAKEELANGIVSEDKTLGFRITTDETLQQIIKQIGVPITATSAQINGLNIPYSLGFLSKLSKKKKSLISLVWDNGRLPERSLSTVVNLVNHEITFLRREDFLKRFNKREGEFEIRSEQEMKMVAQKIWHKLKRIDKAFTILLVGDLGGGKTTLVKAVGKLAGISEIISSPTFGLINEYDVSTKKCKRLIHMDLYRLEKILEVEEMKLEQYLKFGNLIAIEWAERIPPWILNEIIAKSEVLLVETKYIDETTRKVAVWTNLPTATCPTPTRRSPSKSTKTIS